MNELTMLLNTLEHTGQFLRQNSESMDIYQAIADRLQVSRREAKAMVYRQLYSRKFPNLE